MRECPPRPLCCPVLKIPPVCFRLCASRPSTGILRKNLRPQRREIFRLFKAAGRRNTGVFQGRQRSKTENLPLCGALYSDCIVYIKTRILFQSLNDTLLLAAAISCKPQKRNLIFLQNGVFQRIALKLLRSIFMESKAIHFNH